MRICGTLIRRRTQVRPSLGTCGSKPDGKFFDLFEVSGEIQSPELVPTTTQNLLCQGTQVAQSGNLCHPAGIIALQIRFDL